MGCGVVEVHGIDGRGVRSVLHVDAHGDEAVTVGLVEVGPVVDACHGVDVAGVVGVGDLMAVWVPEILVAGLVLGDGEGVLVVVVDGEV